MSYTLENAEERSKEFPDTFQIPSFEERANVKPNNLVKLIFNIIDNNKILNIERMWVLNKKCENGKYSGILDNDPYADCELKAGDLIEYLAENIIDIYIEQINEES